MPQSTLRLTKSYREFLPKREINSLPGGLRGIYVLLKSLPGNKQAYEVVYIGLATNGIKARLWTHNRSEQKRKRWSHFSVFTVWNNVRDEEIKELEGLLRHIYRKDQRANSLNRQRGFGKLRKLDRLETK